MKQPDFNQGTPSYPDEPEQAIPTGEMSLSGFQLVALSPASLQGQVFPLPVTKADDRALEIGRKPSYIYGGITIPLKELAEVHLYMKVSGSVVQVYHEPATYLALKGGKTLAASKWHSLRPEAVLECGYNIQLKLVRVEDAAPHTPYMGEEEEPSIQFQSHSQAPSQSLLPAYRLRIVQSRYAIPLDKLEFSLEEGEVVEIGREAVTVNKHRRLIINEPKVSQYHAWLIKRNGQFELHDGQYNSNKVSRNGTFISNPEGGWMKIAEGTPHFINPGAVAHGFEIKVGHTYLVLEKTEQAELFTE
ncbi:MAG: FHA domain-containing protein [Chloroflexi bacterium]|uniref:FHA domain-containing protein n=1 Tax=Candidatus Chlorohelix allophototropha TaxID=3003348 RepID=A0A8T7M4D2_9CHLR|nr:FHA domain-containing protein [Chloroflexota bacterium]WJW70091.1 FHA domain-containing protein [Chloroflexota bacterium L227-S17]